MATLNIGQRVRIVNSVTKPWLIGKEAIVMSALFTQSDSFTGAPEYRILVNNTVCDFSRDGCYAALPEYLAPLVDPKADEFVERIKKLKPLDTFTEHFAEVWRELTGNEAR